MASEATLGQGYGAGLGRAEASASFGVQSSAMLGLFVPAALMVLNLLDGLFTLSFLQLGVAEEANPLMRAAYHASPLLFMILKLAVVQLGVWILWAHRHAKTARCALQAGTWMYAAIVAYHLSFLASLVFGR